MSELSGTVAQLFHHPVKSVQGLAVDAIDLDADGPRGDRAWGILDVGADLLLSAKRHGALLDCTVDGDDLVLPDGARGALGSAGLDAALTAWLGREVRTVHVDDEPTMRQSMHLDNEDEGSLVISWRTPRGRYIDLYPIHFITTASLAGVRARHPGLDWDVRRFRPNLVLDLDADERALFDTTVQVGDATVRVLPQRTERCVMVTRPQAVHGLAAERGLLRALARDAGKPDAALTAGSAIAELGGYAEVVAPGRVVRGAPVRVLS